MNDHFNKLYSKDFSKTYIACPKDCSECKIWKKSGNIWKFFTYFPYHCVNCCNAGYCDDFYLFNDRAFMCLECYTKAKRELKKRSPYWKHTSLELKN